MSDYESHRGELILRKREENETDKHYFQRVLGDKFKESEWDEEDSVTSCLYEMDLYEKYFYVNGKIYENVNHKELEPYDTQDLDGDDENGYKYFMIFYNGGTCLTEMIEKSLKRKNKE